MELKRLLQEVDLDHNTPLWLAVEAGSASIIELLIEYGSNVNHFNKSKVYPLHSACTNGSLAIVQNLVKVLNATEVVHAYLCQNIANLLVLDRTHFLSSSSFIEFQTVEFEPAVSSNFARVL